MYPGHFLKSRISHTSQTAQYFNCIEFGQLPGSYRQSLEQSGSTQASGRFLAVKLYR